MHKSLNRGIHMNILVIFKKSTLELMLEKGNKAEKQYLKRFRERHAELKRAHLANTHTQKVVLNTLKKHKHNFSTCYRNEFCEIKLTNQHLDLIITVGGDGTLLDIAKYVRDIPILGVNSDPIKSVGWFSHAHADNFAEFITNLDTKPKSTLKRATLTINANPYQFPILNDILITNKKHAEMIRIDAQIGSTQKFLRSSGLLIATPSGSTAWMYNEGGKVVSNTNRQLQYRELGSRNPFNGFSAKPLILTSHMYSGLICIDGSHQHSSFFFGDEIIIQLNGPPLTIYGDIDEKKALLL